MTGHGGNHHKKLGLQRILSASRYTFPEEAGMSTHDVTIINDKWSSEPNLACRTPYFSYPLVSSA